jgi:hypothetical protein
MFEQFCTRSHTRYHDADCRFNDSGILSAKSYRVRKPVDSRKSYVTVMTRLFVYVISEFHMVALLPYARVR